MHASEQDRAKDDVVAAGQDGEDPRPCDVNDRGRADTQSTCLLAYPAGQVGIEGQGGFRDVRAVALHVDQTVGRGRFCHVAQSLSEELFMRGLWDA